MHPPRQEAPQQIHMTMTQRPVNQPMEEETSVEAVTVRLCPWRSNLRTACSETLMLRQRNASMAERSRNSFTGEPLLLPAAAFATLGARWLGDASVHGEGERVPGQGWHRGGSSRRGQWFGSEWF